MLGELLEQRRKEREQAKQRLKTALTIGIVARYLWIITKWALVIAAAGVFAVLYMFAKVIFTGNTGR